ncbi:E3 SUMO-protein ligase CBX4 isoform X2 [Orussus abietinus]|uniref:E3 SUMO-protein ligase CBX4 isoform X2 n=1 Tax=Orussus abietinus TaxID=222816 RepID=UPI000C715C58|nr:E3 SUMO-protein ligase CBX4 isoform X2 [Orussus abietinus]
MEDLGMTASTSSGLGSTVNDVDWFAGVVEEELLHYTGTGNDVDSLWTVIGSFVPPPPRPPYLPEDGVSTDGLTTCDLCSWAWRNDRHGFSLDGALAPGELGWLLTLVIVSLVSAGIGAIVMVTLLHCRRLKSTTGRAGCCGVSMDESGQESAPPGSGAGTGGGVSVVPERSSLELDKLPPYHDVAPSPGRNVWSWLGSRRGGGPGGTGGGAGGGVPGVLTTPLSLPRHRRAMNLPVENHYTHMQTDEALYAELDSQAASYASDPRSRTRGSSTYGSASGARDDEYHELDVAGLHRRYGDDPRSDASRLRRSQRLQEPDYEMYENGPSTPRPGQARRYHARHLHHHHHHHHHHRHRHVPGDGEAPEHPSYQNTAYTGSDAEPDGPTLSSAPSSAYYSDLSSTSASQSTPAPAPPEVAGPTLDPDHHLAAIDESSAPSD